MLNKPLKFNIIQHVTICHAQTFWQQVSSQKEASNYKHRNKYNFYTKPHEIQNCLNLQWKSNRKELLNIMKWK